MLFRFERVIPCQQSHYDYQGYELNPAVFEVFDFANDEEARWNTKRPA
ncbi:hypothetical protein IKE71_01275 [Candidatus Saccharibacteria bacterium]|nr:hypothetical protein [Candidatus Saccharibacteria bacterium]